MAAAKPDKGTLTSLAATLDTRKRPLPADARPPSAALQERLVADPQNRPVAPPVPAATSGKKSEVTMSRAEALSSLRREPSPPPARVPVTPPAQGGGKTRRKYPRTELAVRAKLSLADDPSRSFEAALPTVDISVGGMFLESSFFLKMGTRLLVTLQLPPKGRAVRVKGEVVRVVTQASGESGFALRFTEYLDGSEVALATHFLSPLLRDFLTAYAKQHRFEASPEYIAHTVDVLAAWELKKAELGSDIWALTGARK